MYHTSPKLLDMRDTTLKTSHDIGIKAQEGLRKRKYHSSCHRFGTLFHQDTIVTTVIVSVYSKNTFHLLKTQARFTTPAQSKKLTTPTSAAFVARLTPGQDGRGCKRSQRDVTG
jgi:hypothetical protein